MRKRPSDIYYVLDISLREKFAGLAYSGTAGVLAGFATKEVAALGLRAASMLIAFPEFTAPLIGAIAFSHAANASSETWARHVPPAALRMRKKRRPRLTF